jgi:hypothetical protein
MGSEKLSSPAPPPPPATINLGSLDGLAVWVQPLALAEQAWTSDAPPPVALYVEFPPPP